MGLFHAVHNHLCGLHYHSGIRGQGSNLLPLPVIETRLPGNTAIAWSLYALSWPELQFKIVSNFNGILLNLFAC